LHFTPLLKNICHEWTQILHECGTNLCLYSLKIRVLQFVKQFVSIRGKKFGVFFRHEWTQILFISRKERKCRKEKRVQFYKKNKLRDFNI